MEARGRRRYWLQKSVWPRSMNKHRLWRNGGVGSGQPSASVWYVEQGGLARWGPACGEG